MGRVIADGLSDKAQKNLDEIDAQTIKIKGEAIGSMAERNLFVSENEPDDSQGEDGDVWFQYE